MSSDPNSNDVRVLIVADDPLVRAGLATILSSQPGCNVTGQVAGEAALADAIPVYQPEVILWDSPLALESGPNIRELGVPVVALLSNGADAARTWIAGARGLVRRSASAPNLAAALAAAAQGLTVIDPEFVSALLPTARDQPPAQPVEDLTPRELQVLGLMAEGQSNKTIARKLGISEHTVKFHVNSILGKLGVQSRTEAVVHATRLGIVLL